MLNIAMNEYFQSVRKAKPMQQAERLTIGGDRFMRGTNQWIPADR